MNWLERWVRPQGPERRPMMVWGAGIGSLLTLMAGAASLIQFAMLFTSPGDSLVSPLPGWLSLVLFASLASFLFQVSRVYFHVAHRPDPQVGLRSTHAEGKD